MKTKRISENTKVTLTIGQLRRLVKESDGNGEGKQCRWVAWSDDGSYDDESDKTFEYEEDAYEDMAKNAVSKMLWNTEPSDFNDCDSIGYQVMFTPNAISHKSYSGTYVWAIIDEDKVLTDDEKREIEARVWRKKVRESVQDGDKEECTFSEFRKFAKSLGYKVASKTWDFGGFGYGSSRFYKVFSGDRLVHVLNPKKKDEYVSGWWDKAMELDPELQEFVLSHRIVDDRDPSVKCIPEG